MKKIIGIMGPNNATKANLKDAYEIGKYMANNGLTIGIMPFNEPEKFSKYVDIPIITNMRSGRNYINALSSNLVIACGVDKGTISEVSLSLVKRYDEKQKRNVDYILTDKYIDKLK